MYLYLLSKENLELGKAEIESITGTECKLENNILITGSYNKEIMGRLAFTKKVFKILFSCSVGELESGIKGYDWSTVYDKNYCVRSYTKGFSDKAVSSIIWNELTDLGIKPKVDLSNPSTSIELFQGKNLIHVCLLLGENKEKFEERKAHKLSKLHPTGMHPKIARGMVNLTGAERGETIYDPFCGGGGLLIEAGLIRLKIWGQDNEKIIVAKCKENILGMKLNNFKIELGDSLNLSKKMKYIATDLPYGIGTKKLSKDFYEKAFTMIRKNLKTKGKASIGIPSKLNYKKLIEKNKLKVLFDNVIYIHKSLSKRIILVEKKQ